MMANAVQVVISLTDQKFVSILGEAAQLIHSQRIRLEKASEELRVAAAIGIVNCAAVAFGEDNRKTFIGFSDNLIGLLHDFSLNVLFG